MTIADRIDELLKKQKTSRRQLAIKAGIPPSSFQSAMQRGGTMTLDMMKKVAHALGVQVQDLYSDKPELKEWVSRVLDMVSDDIDQNVDKEYIDQLHGEEVTSQLDKGLDRLCSEFGIDYQNQSFSRETVDEERRKYAKAFEIAYRVGVLEGLKGVRPPNADTLIAAGVDEKYAGFIMQFKKQSVEEQKALLDEMKHIHRQKLEQEGKV